MGRRRGERPRGRARRLARAGRRTRGRVVGLDIVLFARDPAALLVRDDWVAAFGRPRLTFLEPTAVGEQLERRVLYEDGTDVDFAIVPVELLDHPAVAHVASRGIRVLVDKDGELGSRLAELPEPAPPSPPNEAALRELAADFFYHAVWAARKLRRGEVFTAKRCVDSYMENVLIRILDGGHTQRIRTWTRGTPAASSSGGPIRPRSRSSEAPLRPTTGGRPARALRQHGLLPPGGPGDGRPSQPRVPGEGGRVRHELVQLLP